MAAVAAAELEGCGSAGSGSAKHPGAVPAVQGVVDGALDTEPELEQPAWVRTLRWVSWPRVLDGLAEGQGCRLSAW